jgi:outer membrane receptor protein involved in Fe transport
MFTRWMASAAGAGAIFISFNSLVAPPPSASLSDAGGLEEIPSPVGVSLDGVAHALPIQTQGQLFDIDRVEVLRGPQGTLYGRNTAGGEINF